jgi:hypothetical protein
MFPIARYQDAHSSRHERELSEVSTRADTAPVWAPGMLRCLERLRLRFSLGILIGDPMADVSEVCGGAVSILSVRRRSGG